MVCRTLATTALWRLTKRYAYQARRNPDVWSIEVDGTTYPFGSK